MTTMQEEFDRWATDGRKLGGMERQFAWDAWQAATLAERERCAKVCETPVEVLCLPEAPEYDGDERNIERRVALALAAAIRAEKP